MTLIREELPEDIEAIFALNRESFGGSSEAERVNRLRASNALTLSLVAVEEGGS